MKKIQMVDLFTQYQNIKTEVDAAIQNIISQTAFVKGKEVKEFENNLANYLNVKHVIACGNGTDALQLALMALNLPKGAEIITPSFTFIATAEVIALLGYKPVFVDVTPDTFNIDTKEIEKAVSPKTKAILPVHLFGQAADMASILALAEKHNLYVIEDTAQALGAEYISPKGKIQKLGTLGKIGCTSFFPSKNLGAFGDGGALFTNNDKLAEKIRILANHGMKTRYYHDFIGVNSRLDAIQAAVLNVKLKKLDEYNKNRQKAADFYNEALKKCKFVQTPVRNKNSTHIFHQYTLKVEERRDELKTFLASREIPAMIYYPVPLHKQKAFAETQNNKFSYQVSEDLAKKVLSLPMHTELSSEQLNFITSSILEFFSIE